VTEHAPYQRSTFYSFDPMYVNAFNIGSSRGHSHLNIGSLE
jgi:hypothetical protein